MILFFSKWFVLISEVLRPSVEPIPKESLRSEPSDRIFLIKCLWLLGLSFTSIPSYGSKDDQFPTASLKAYGGYSVYKSEMVQSNDTAFVVGYGFEFFAGRENEFGFGLDREAASLAFGLNNSKISIKSDLFRVTYALGPLWIGPLFNYTLWDVESPPDLDNNEFLDQNAQSEPYLKASSQGIGVHGGAHFSLGKKAIMHLKFASVSSTTALQETPPIASLAGVTGTSPSTARVIEIGPRTDFDLGAMILLTKDMLHILYGFKATTYQLKIADKTFAETHNTTYLGLMGTWNF